MGVLLLILKIILYLISVLLLIIITFLIVPFTYKGEAEVYDGIIFSYKLGWFWNLFNIRGSRGNDEQTTAVYLFNKRLFTVKDRTAAKVEKKKPDEAEAEAEEADHKDNNLKSMFDKKLIKEFFSYLKKIKKQISPKYLHLHGTYGFDDPSLTGMTAGFVYTLQGIWPQSRIHLQPSFTEEILELELKVQGNIYAGKLIVDTGRFLLKPEVKTKIFKKKKKVKQKLRQ